MSNCFSYYRTHRKQILVTLAMFSFMLVGTSADAYKAELVWEPVSEAAGYNVYVRYGDQQFGPPLDIGAVERKSDGRLHATIVDVPVGPTASFAVSAYNSEGVEGERSNEQAIHYAEAAKIVDSDGDGLTDAQEDTNLNQRVDTGETDPQNADSDSDGSNDGDEVASGRNPLIPDGATCGDGVVEGAEACDDGNSNNDDGCLSNCKRAECTSATADKDCNDGNVCTDNVCSNGVCRKTFNTKPCNDRIACTSRDQCSNGTCSGYEDCLTGEICNVQTDICEEIVSPGEAWVPAAAFPSALLKGEMAIGGEFSGGADADPRADAIATEQLYPASYTDAYDAHSGDEVEYTVTLSESAEWYLWGRFYYPGAGNDANSFFVSVDGGEPLKFGNNRDYFRQWHWDGDGRVDSGGREPLALGRLSAGRHSIAISKRESGDNPPQLDVLHFTTSPDVSPADEDAEAVLSECPDGSCGGGFSRGVCGDANGNGDVAVVDAWLILQAAIGVDNRCSHATCDVDLDGRIRATDAVMALNEAVGLDVSLGCRKTMGVALTNASPFTRMTFEVDYDAAPIAVDAEPKCSAVGDLAPDGLAVSHDRVGRRMVVDVDYATPVRTDQVLLECAFYTASDGAQLPSPTTISTTVLSYDRPAGESSGEAPRIGATFLLP